jgi:hypothetical protein
MRAACYTDKEQNYIRLTTKPIDPSPRKRAEGQTLPSQNTFNKKKKNALQNPAALSVSRAEDCLVFKCKKYEFFPKSALFLVIGILSVH